MSETILIIGATGRTGTELVKLLTLEGKNVRAATRNIAKAAVALPGTCEFVEFDYDRPETFAPALANVQKIFLMARPGDNHSDKAASPLIDEARKKNIERIVALTAMGVEQDETFMLRILEKYIENSGIPYVHLRPNWFMQNFDSGPMFADISSTGALHLPAADATISFIDVRDIAAVGVRMLQDPAHVGKAFTLTGNEALNHFQVMEKISAAAGRELRYVPITEEVSRESLAKAGVPVGLIDRWTDFYRKIRAGFCSPVLSDVETVLNRRPIAFEQYAVDHAGRWK